jgi:hypothetical protein
VICRMWHGRTPRSKADAYTRFLEQRAIPDYRSIPGNLSVAVLRRDADYLLEFEPLVQHYTVMASANAV